MDLLSADQSNFAPPDNFPHPTIRNGQLIRVNIREHGGNGNIIEVTCIQCQESGNVYQFVRTLRDCIYGKVKHAIQIRIAADGVYDYTTVQVAIKVMYRQRIREMRGRHNENPMSEIAAMEYLSDPGNTHVLSLIECVMDDQRVYCIFPFCGSELFSHVESSGRFDEPTSKTLFLQILEGVRYIHERYVCHRDMSLENVLVTENQCKIIDFGMCLKKPVGVDRRPLLIRPSGQCGKRNYMSPEIYSNTNPFDGLAIDLWACGVMLFIMLTGVPPFEVPSTIDQRFRMVNRGGLAEMLRMWDIHISDEAADLLQGMLRMNQSDRFTLTQILEHPWVTG
mmetsp:Transcript_12561/g.16494  ORF Transcript_12561/g.16494 Transcript_12561/m.16494 type:complete len:337 (+) Transcript_12561:127-1137(+)